MAREQKAGLWREFRDFVQRGNVIDLAVAVVMGAAFGKVVDSFVKDVLMPPIGLLLGKTDFSNLFLVLRDGSTPGPYSTLAAGAVTIGYGALLNNVVSFLIIAFSVFLIVRVINRARRQPEAVPPPAPPEDVMLLRDIRDELRLQRPPITGTATSSELPRH